MLEVKHFDVFVVCNKIDCIPVQEQEEKINYIKTELKKLLPIVKDSNVHKISCKELVPKDTQIQQLTTLFFSHLSKFIVKLLHSQQTIRLALLEDHLGPLNQFISTAELIKDKPNEEREEFLLTVQHDLLVAMKNLTELQNAKSPMLKNRIKVIVEKHVDGYFNQISFFNPLSRLKDKDDITVKLKELSRQIDEEVIGTLANELSKVLENAPKYRIDVYRGYDILDSLPIAFVADFFKHSKMPTATLLFGLAVLAGFMIANCVTMGVVSATIISESM